MNHFTSITPLRAACASALLVFLFATPAAYAQHLQLTAGSTLSPVVTASLLTNEEPGVYVHDGPAERMPALVPPVSGAYGMRVHVQDTSTTTGRMVVGGILGATVGMLVGGAVGAGVEVTLSERCYDYCGLGGTVLGAVVGESLGMAFGVHAGNYRRGSYSAAVVGPLGVLVGSLALGMVLDDTEVPASFIVIGVPVLQLFTSMAGERAAARRRAGPPE